MDDDHEEVSQGPAISMSVKELLLETPVLTNVSEEELSRTYLAIESLFGEGMLRISAVACRWLLMTVAADADFQLEAGPRRVAVMASIAYVLSDAMMCFLEVAGRESHPLYHDIQSGLEEIDRQLKKGMKAWKRYYKKRLRKAGKRLVELEAQSSTQHYHHHTNGSKRRRRSGEPQKGAPGVVVLAVKQSDGNTPRQSGSIRLCGKCPTCLAVMEGVKGRSSITQHELATLVSEAIYATTTKEQ